MTNQTIDLADLLNRCTFPSEQEVVCAVSGGADSLAMMILAKEAGKNVTVMHVDHSLREQSKNDAKFVMQMAERFEMNCEVITVVVEPGPNLEARARSARFRALPSNALLAHTVDDQAETVLLNLIRGSGLRGLAGIRTERHPILQLRRSETHAVCDLYQIEPIVDISNDDLTIRRNQIRQQLVPIIDGIAQRDVSELIARNAQLVRDDDDYLDKLAKAIEPTNAAALRAAPAPLARRAIRMWLETIMVDDLGDSHPPSYAAVNRVMAVANNDVLAADVGAGFRVRRSNGILFIENSSESSE